MTNGSPREPGTAVVGVILSVIVVGLTLAAFCRQPEKEGRSWKVFSNRAGWSILYPADWKIASCRMCTDPAAPNVFVDFFPPIDNGSDGWVMVDHLSNKPSGVSVDAWFNDLERKANLNPIIDEQRLTLSGLPALRVRYRNPYVGEMESVYIISGSRTFEVEFADEKPLRPMENMRNYPTYRRMLGTFKVRP